VSCEDRVAIIGRKGHTPREESNEWIYLFVEYIRREQHPAEWGKCWNVPRRYGTIAGRKGRKRKALDGCILQLSGESRGS
jgi:hypothetical protein